MHPENFEFYRIQYGQHVLSAIIYLNRPDIG